uniref:Hylambates kassinin n=1 Tax=Phlyctimantis maculatus TaxID=2517390 RepID=TKN1_PHLMA|nr:RecName: Full=Hylambates kassinin; AltName: Full=[Glu2,Pro5]-kassinin [Kassina cochranae]prf//0801196A hylambatin [Kassina cochranae]
DEPKPDQFVGLM